MQQLFIFCLTYQSIITSARCWKCGVIAPGPLDELKTILKTTLVANKKKTSFIVRFISKLGSIRNPISDHTSHFHGVSVSPGVDFANMRTQRTYEFFDPFKPEIISGLNLVRVRVIYDRSSCQSLSADPNSGKSWPNNLTLTIFPPPHQLCATMISTPTTCRREFVDKIYPSLDILF